MKLNRLLAPALCGLVLLSGCGGTGEPHESTSPDENATPTLTASDGRMTGVGFAHRLGVAMQDLAYVTITRDDSKDDDSEASTPDIESTAVMYFDYSNPDNIGFWSVITGDTTGEVIIRDTICYAKYDDETAWTQTYTSVPIESLGYGYWIQILESAPTITEVDSEEVNGALATKYRVDGLPDKITDPDDIAPTFIWVDDSDRAVKMELIGVGFTTTMYFGDFDVSKEIPIPTGEGGVDASETESTEGEG